MIFPESWLRTFCNPSLSSDALAQLLTMSGLEVEEKRGMAPPFTGVVVAEVKKVDRHPDADRLTVCEVDIGDGFVHQVVCGAPNVAVGLKTPCAVPGAVLPDGMKIKAAKLRGVSSAGMLCSARELAISDDASGLLVLPDDAPVGADLRDYLKLDDQLLTLKLTPNRGDCLGIVGLAREVAALTGAALHVPTPASVKVSIADRLPVSISAPDLCGRFSGRVIRGVNARAPTPDWMKRRLEQCGQRSISALVDISNYVMLELNHPNHIFDLGKVERSLEVRWARAGERLLLLNGQTVDLVPDVGVIADARGVESLAGVMGGDAIAVSDETRDVYIEAAFWFPQAVAGRPQRYGFTSEASHRFERGVDFADTVAGVERVSELILQICGGNAGPLDDQVVALPERKPILLRPARFARFIGLNLSTAEIAEIFTRQGFEFKEDNGDLLVTPPSWRFDLEIEEDLIEEIARIHGYDNVPAHAPHAALTMLPETESTRPLERLRDLLIDRGLQEVVNYAFVAEAWENDFAANCAPVRLANPIASQMSVMRSTLIGALVDNLATNLRRRENRVRIFETGRCFVHDNAGDAVEGFNQPLRLAVLLYGSALPEQWGAAHRFVDFFDGKGLVETILSPAEMRAEPCPHPAFHPGRSARVLLDGNPVGVMGELHPQWVQKYELAAAPVLIELDLAPLLKTRLPGHKPVSKFPPVFRDIAITVAATTPVQAILDELRKRAPESVIAIRLFDQYVGKGVDQGEKSLAFRVVMQDTQRTLLDAEIDEAVARLVAAAQQGFNARLRN